MKRTGILLILFIAISAGVWGQEDSLHIKTQSTTGPVQSDPLRLYEKDPSNLDKGLYDKLATPEMDEMTFSYPTSKKMKSFLNAPYTKFIIPTAMLTYGLVAQGNHELKELDRSTDHEVKEHYLGRFPADNYLQYAPYAAYYGLDVCGIKAKHNFRDRTIVLAASYAIMGTTVIGMKNAFHVERPDGSSKSSFPSGHTATAFLGAHLLFLEYKDVSPWIGVAGYLSAATVGGLRIVNKRHWLSDVVAGAGIGILSAEAGYLLLPVSHKLFGIKEGGKSLVVAPMISPGSYGAGLAYTF